MLGAEQTAVADLLRRRHNDGNAKSKPRTPRAKLFLADLGLESDTSDSTGQGLSGTARALTGSNQHISTPSAGGNTGSDLLADLLASPSPSSPPISPTDAAASNSFRKADRKTSLNKVSEQLKSSLRNNGNVALWPTDKRPAAPGKESRRTSSPTQSVSSLRSTERRHTAPRQSLGQVSLKKLEEGNQVRDTVWIRQVFGTARKKYKDLMDKDPRRDSIPVRFRHALAAIRHAVRQRLVGMQIAAAFTSNRDDGQKAKQEDQLKLAKQEYIAKRRKTEEARPETFWSRVAEEAKPDDDVDYDKADDPEILQQTIDKLRSSLFLSQTDGAQNSAFDGVTSKMNDLLKMYQNRDQDLKDISSNIAGARSIIEKVMEGIEKYGIHESSSPEDVTAIFSLVEKASDVLADVCHEKPEETVERETVDTRMPTDRGDSQEDVEEEEPEEPSIYRPAWFDEQSSTMSDAESDKSSLDYASEQPVEGAAPKEDKRRTPLYMPTSPVTPRPMTRTPSCPPKVCLVPQNEFSSRTKFPVGTGGVATKVCAPGEVPYGSPRFHSGFSFDGQAWAETSISSMTTTSSLLSASSKKSSPRGPTMKTVVRKVKAALAYQSAYLQQRQQRQYGLPFGFNAWF